MSLSVCMLKKYFRVGYKQRPKKQKNKQISIKENNTKKKYEQYHEALLNSYVLPV